MVDHQKILVYIDHENRSTLALEKAVNLAKQSGARLTVVSVIYDLVLDILSAVSTKYHDLFIEQTLQENLKWMEALCQPYKVEGIPINLEIGWDKLPIHWLNELVEVGKFDLVVKAFDENSQVNRFWRHSLDKQLLRQCPSPVLFVRKSDTEIADHVLTAIDLTQTDKFHFDFNQTLMAESACFAKLRQSDIHIINSFSNDQVDIAIRPDNNDVCFEVKGQGQQQIKLHDTFAEFDLDNEHIHVLEGMADDTIPELADELHANLVVIGANSRTGLGEFLFGHTAEYVIDQLHCDVLAVKPRGC